MEKMQESDNFQPKPEKNEKSFFDKVREMFSYNRGKYRQNVDKFPADYPRVYLICPRMLQKLSIQNYAIIDQLQISFSNNLNIITGETGAGKSILMGALNLILGQRADSSVLQDPSKKCIVEGFFRMPGNPSIQRFFELNELDMEADILLRREIASNGKSRSFINDTPVTLAQLKELSLLLVDLHQQFDTLDLGEKDFQREVLDALADNAVLLQELKQNIQSLPAQ
jgi:DNA repair protein RecN (Recombination protein N)